jgi:exodeoxyribonuclease V gamma subunit
LAFDGVTLDGARALDAPRAPRAPFLTHALPPLDADVVELEDMVRFVERPVRAFLRQRLGITVTDYSDEIDDALPVELDALEKWNVGQRLLDARLAGTPLDTALAAEVARGALPPGNLAAPVQADITPIVEVIADAAETILAPDAPTTSIDVKLTLPDGRTLSGTVPGVCGDCLRTVTYSRVNPRHRLAVWVRWLALTAAHPERPFTAATIGRGRSGTDARVTIARLAPFGNDPEQRRQQALEHLTTIAELHARGLREPLPLACLTSAAYSEAAHAGGDPIRAATNAWESSYAYDKEDRAPEHELVYGGVKTCAELLGDPRFERDARALWDPLLSHEVIDDR